MLNVLTLSNAHKLNAVSVGAIKRLVFSLVEYQGGGLAIFLINTKGGGRLAI